MEIKLSPELQAKLDRIASQQGRDVKSPVHEAVERLADYDEWFIRQVEMGVPLLVLFKRAGFDLLACPKMSAIHSLASTYKFTIDKRPDLWYGCA
jgi:hypothetical protein